MRSIQIVTHCWRFSRVLRYQLASLVLHPPSTDVVLRVFYTSDDKPTCDVLSHYEKKMGNVRLMASDMPLRQLGKRAIGRDLAARETTADIVWFTDADVCFYDECLDYLAQCDLSTGPMWHPQYVWVTTTKEIGDKYTLARHKGEPQVSFDDCSRGRVRQAYGPYQIVPGDVCRSHGYPTGRDNDKTESAYGVFHRNFADVRVRKRLAALFNSERQSRGLDIPNVIRIRQSVSGVVDTL